MVDLRGSVLEVQIPTTLPLFVRLPARNCTQTSSTLSLLLAEPNNRLEGEEDSSIELVLTNGPSEGSQDGRSKGLEDKRSK